MGRHVLAAQAHCGRVKLDLFNTHLESTKEHAEEGIGDFMEHIWFRLGHIQ